MDQQTSTAIATLASAVQSVQQKISQGPRESIFAPSANDPYVVPGPRDFYSYTQRTPAAGIAAGATVALVYQVEADSYFYFNALTYTADIALAAVTESSWVLPLVTITILDTGSGRQLMANPTPIPSIMGSGERPFRLPKPRRVAPTAQLQVTLVNYSAATTYNISVTLSGFKVYSPQAIAVNGPIGS
jgi:hypothetical protein